MYAVGARADEMPIDIPVDHDSRAKIIIPDKRKDRRKMFRRLPYVSVPGYAPICLDTNDPFTVECGFKKRLLRVVPEVDHLLLKRFKAFVQDFCEKYIPKVDPMSFEDWLASTSYNDERKIELRGVYDELKGQRPTMKRSRKVDSFVKSESYQEYKHARMINSRCDEFKVYSGPCFKAIEKVVYELKYFIKHTPVADRPKFITALKKDGLRYFVTDYTSFEASFSVEFMRACECVLYTHCLGEFHGDFIQGVLTGTNEMKTRSGVRARCKGRRMSGDTCTSLGNGFSNLMLALFFASEQGVELNGFVEGDDGIFATDGDFVADDYAKLGFIIKIQEVPDPCLASFCGLIFSDSEQIIRDPSRFIQKFGWTSSFIHGGDKLMKELLKAKALSALFECPHCPIVSPLARYGLGKVMTSKARHVYDGYHEKTPDDFEIPQFAPTTSTRVAFEKMFGITIDTQLSVEKAISEGDMMQVSQLLPASDHMLDFSLKYLEIA